MSDLHGIKANEAAVCGSTQPWSVIQTTLKLTADGLLPAIAQQYDTGEVLMLAWMNMAALDETLMTGRVCYWSRSRNKLWRKGEESGQVQHLKEIRIDCDGDALLLLVDQTGPACHTGRVSCFYNAIRNHQVEVITAPLIDPAVLYHHK
ncbi:phosphoribosyl-AMP cyclohydrolase [Thiospirillum jenense]|uniref:Phosphoribosyl-AMP cyclohydrolase n=1 Tax=Thiospirillum jenense TaxID=1653858 RepID=A0A839HDP0_9GAMM|nr:phosphoribosyl-AMP cyclohydrolase [Thiospirillum jenense]MBB1127003.1 phosphoribosyl-AMP cyclohydrolase [Thiospirillum jenense]